MDDSLFTFARPQLEAMADFVLTHANRLGATDATVRIDEGDQLSVSVRNAELDTMQHSYEKRMSITLQVGNRSGSSFSSDFTPAALAEATDAAFHIASRTAEDPFCGPAERGEYLDADLALDLFHPWQPDNDEAIDIAARVEAAALADVSADDHGTGPTMRAGAARSSGGATLSASHGQFLLATSKGFCQGYPFSSHALNCEVIAAGDSEMQSAYWMDMARVAQDLRSPEEIGRIAARRVLSKMNATQADTGIWPVIFEAPVATSLLRPLLHAIGGDAQYRGDSFLPGCLGKRLLAEHVGIIEAPHEPRGLGSSPFDDEGVPTVERMLVRNGTIETYLLDCYAARRLGMPLSGHAGGVRNARLVSSRTGAGDGLSALIGMMGTGLVVTDLIGGGVNPVTGDYSQAVSGFWVEGGEARHPVQDVTIAGNLRDILAGIVAVGSDEYNAGTMRSGSVLLDRIQIAGT